MVWWWWCAVVCFLVWCSVVMGWRGVVFGSAVRCGVCGGRGVMKCGWEIW